MSLLCLLHFANLLYFWLLLLLWLLFLLSRTHIKTGRLNLKLGCLYLNLWRLHHLSLLFLFLLNHFLLFLFLLFLLVRDFCRFFACSLGWLLSNCLGDVWIAEVFWIWFWCWFLYHWGLFWLCNNFLWRSLLYLFIFLLSLRRSYLSNALLLWTLNTLILSYRLSLFKLLWWLCSANFPLILDHG